LGEALAAAGHEVKAVALVDHPLPEHVDASYTSEQVADLARRFRPDLAIVGNLHSARADAWMIGLLAERCPTLCVLHDFWLVTGRCGYPRGCEKYLTGCDESCPTPQEYPQLEPRKIAGAWRAKRQLLETQAPILMANSNWTAEYVRSTLRASGKPARVETFRLSFPLHVFRPLNRKMCREALGLPQDRFIVLTTSEFSDPRKGTGYLLEALRELGLPELLLVSTSWSAADAGQLGSLESRQMGYIVEPERLAMVYAAADVFVGTSQEETFGQTFIEAIACGTPVVGFPVTGVAEAIVDGVTGRMAAGVSAAQLGTAILELYRNPGLREDIGRWGRLYVENEWSSWAAYRYFFQSLDRLGLLDQMHVPHKISFLPASPPLAPPQLLSQVTIRQPTVFQLARIGILRIVSARRGKRAEETLKVAGLSIHFAMRHLRGLVNRRTNRLS
jgi:glycosyltransferase involved in cell wall biosynthesis